MHFGLVKEENMVRKSIRIFIEHDGQQLEWDVTEMSHMNKIEECQTFKHINQYWASLSAFKQEKIWQTYKSISETMMSSFDPMILLQKLQPLIKDLYDEHQVSQVERWVNLNYLTHQIHIPSRYVTDYIHTDLKPGSREQTYTRHDYERLICLVIALRAMIPIWGEFISATKKETGKEYKERVAFDLLAKSEIYECQAISKLKAYISYNLKSDRSMIPSTLVGIGSDDYVQYVLSKLVVNRISVGDIRGDENQHCLVISSYSYIKPLIAAGMTDNNAFDNNVKSREFSNGDSDSDPSRLECYKIKSEHAQGNISAFDIYVRKDNLEYAAKKLYPEIDLDLLHLLMETNKVLHSEKIHACQSKLMQWVVEPIIVPRASDYMQRENNITCITLAQTVLWQRGHRKLSLFISAASTRETHSHQISGLGSMSKLSRDQQAALNEYYPYQNPRVTIGKPKAKPNNPAIVAISSLADQFSISDWIISAPDEMVREELGNLHQRRFGCPHDIKQLLANLVIDIAERKKQRYLQSIASPKVYSLSDLK